MRTFGNAFSALGGAVLCLVLPAPAVQAAINVSTQPTQNMSCSHGVCSPTAQKAYLNVSDVSNMLAIGDLKITTGAGIQAQDIHVEAPFSWASTSRLTLEANRNITVDAAITAAGMGALTVNFVPAAISPPGNVPDRGLTFGPSGHVEFWDLKSSLIIRGIQYRLVKNWSSIRHAIKNSYGPMALATSYDAANDGTHDRDPITKLPGLEGLGNAITNLTVVSKQQYVGLIGENDGDLRDLVVKNVNVTGTAAQSETGGVVGYNRGKIENCYVDGVVSSTQWDAGGLVGANQYSISNSHSHATVTGASTAGGLVAQAGGTVADSSADGAVKGSIAGGLSGFVGYVGLIQRSYATGSVSGDVAGGLAGASGNIENSYATGTVTATDAGGFLGSMYYTGYINTSYSTGFVTGSSHAGGFAGHSSSYTRVSDTYWDLKTSGISDPAQGAGDSKNFPGITGLTNAQLKSGLPAGFDPTIWGQNPNINNGYPYLLANPPPN